MTGIGRGKGCVVVQWQSGRTLRVPLRVFRRCPLEAGARAEPEEYAACVAEAEYPCAMEAAAALLAQRERSAADIVRSLRERGYSGVTVDRAVAYLISRRYLDDGRLSEAFTDRLGGRMGSNRIRQKLKEKGIDPDTIEESLGRIDPEAQIEAAAALAKPRLARATEEGRKDPWRDAVAFLLRRGFPYEVAKAALERAREGREL